MKRVSFHNLGCKVNAYETEAMIRQLQERGYERVPFGEEADVCVINTCTVTNIADRKSRQMLHKARKKNPNALVVAVGCYVQADPDAAAADAAVDLIIGNDRKGDLADLIEARMSAVEDLRGPRSYEPIQAAASEEHTRAIIKAQDGCNQFCSYCLIPYVRGRARSRRPEDVILEARLLAARGFSEVVLTGIHLSSYGRDLPDTIALQDLILRVAEIPQIQRIRLGSLEPRIITREFAAALRGTGKICPHFHLSLQSGCEETLRRMNRRYTPDEYRERCRILREVFDHPAITTDVIVGFPGETEEEFRKTLTFLQEISLYEIHVFKYSRRKGTRADSMPDQVEEPVKTARSKILQDLTAAQSDVYRRSRIGKEAEVLLEEPLVRDGQEGWIGHTREYLRIFLPGTGTPGEIRTVTLTGDMLAE